MSKYKSPSIDIFYSRLIHIPKLCRYFYFMEASSNSSPTSHKFLAFYSGLFTIVSTWPFIGDFTLFQQLRIATDIT